MLVKFVEKLANRLGFELRRGGLIRHSPRKIGPFWHQAILSNATYAPWLGDVSFLETYDAIFNNTLVDIYRCYELWDLLPQTLHLPGDILEVGAWRGGTGCLLGARASTLNADKKTYLFDTFKGVVKVSDKDSFYSGGEHADAALEDVQTLAQTLGLCNLEIRRGIFPDDFQAEMGGRTFCLVHIDVDIYQSAKDVMNFVWPKMPAGGIVVFDDYGCPNCDGIPKLVAEYRQDKDKIITYNLNGHAVVIKLTQP